MFDFSPIFILISVFLLDRMKMNLININKNIFPIAICFVLAAIVAVLVAWYVSEPLTKSTLYYFQNTHIFGFDDSFRYFISQDPFRGMGLWFWSFVLPGNIVVDGALSWAVNHNQFVMRVVHAFFYLAGVLFAFKAGLELGLNRIWLLLSVAMLVFMPYGMLLSMTFFGESLLAAIIGFLIYVLALNKKKMQMALLSILPFFRPEGAFLLVASFFDSLFKRRFVFAVLLMLPSIFYLFVLLLYFDGDLFKYFDWRVVFLQMNGNVPRNNNYVMNALEPYFTVNWLWWLLGLLGFFSPLLKILRPLFVGAMAVVVFYFFGGLLSARNETRYLFSFFPLLMLAQAAALTHADAFFDGIKQKLVRLLGALCVLYILVSNIANLNLVEILASRAVKGLDNSSLPQSMQQVANFSYAYSNYDPSISKVLVSSPLIFDVLDPHLYRNGVEVEISSIGPELTYKYNHGLFFVWMPELPQYYLFELGAADGFSGFKTDGYALYIGRKRPLQDASVKPLFVNPYFYVYKVKYKQFRDYPYALRSQ